MGAYHVAIYLHEIVAHFAYGQKMEELRAYFKDMDWRSVLDIYGDASNMLYVPYIDMEAGEEKYLSDPVVSESLDRLLKEIETRTRRRYCFDVRVFRLGFAPMVDADNADVNDGPGGVALISGGQQVFGGMF
jgi:hypothetical protein